jgi:uncharacterized protein (DUF2147 family)
MKYILVMLALGASAGAACAQATPVGLWKTIDDDGKTEKSLVRISEANGVLSGRIVKILVPADANAVCDMCTDERKGQPVQGMEILRNIRQNADNKGLWDGGEVMDPNKGETYKARLKPIDGGRKLEMRGYIGAPMFGRTQTWIRVE